MPEKNINATIYAVGTERGRSVAWAMVDGRKVVIPTDAVTMAKLAQYGVKIHNEA